MSPNHGGSIIQVLYPDGRVGALTSAKVNGGHDDMFSNMVGEVGAGYGREDVVLGPSDATPNIFVISAGPSRSESIRRRQMHGLRIGPERQD